ncbi:MAG: sensor histidine kinase [Rhodocyclaceae bacterium]|jgi:signal transduction histidine kinase|nr:sensor histidine kinase [Rhodocyclaceae bacterium]MBK6908219.1 sensor histidine kinase [Rhodocyclaceae bacterium]
MNSVTPGVGLQFTASTALLVGLVLALFVGAGLFSLTLRNARDSQRKQRDASLRDVAAQHSQLINHLPVAVFTWRPVQGFTTLSEGICRLVPHTASKILADPALLLEAIHPDDAPSLRKLLLSGEPLAETTWLGRTAPHRNSSSAWLQLYAKAEVATDGCAVLSGILLDVTPLKCAQIELERAQEALRRFAAKREHDREAERLHLAQEFHDDLGQLLTGARMRLQLLARDASGAQAKIITEIDEMISETYRSMKAIAAELRPPALNLGLSAAIEWQAERSLTPQEIRLTTAWRFDTEALPDDIRTALFRIVQEAFTNIARYAQAHSVHLSLRPDGPFLVLELADDGVGFEPATVDTHTHFGLMGMRERALALGGDIEIDSAGGEGTRLKIQIPLPSPALTLTPTPAGTP